MADNLINYTQGTAGGTIATDEVTIGGVVVHAQRVKVIDGTEGGTAGLAISSSGVAQTFQTNSGTVSVSNTVATWNSNGGTITLGGVSGAGTLLGAAGTVNVGNAVAVWPNSAGTTTIAGVTNGGTLLGAAGTVNVANTVAVWNSNGGTATIGGVTSGGTLLGAAGTVNVANAVAVWPNSAGTVTQGTDPWIIAGTVTSSVSVGDVAITGGTVAVTQETSPWVIAGTVDTTVNVGDVAITGGTLDLVKAGTVAAWVNTAGTVSVSNTVPVWTNNGGTVVVSNVTGGGTLLGAAGTVNVANTVATWNSNGGTVTLGGVSTADALEVWPNSAGTVSVSSGVVAAWVNTAGTVASVATYEGKTRGGTIINLSASGTVVSAVASNYLKVYSEHFTSTGTIVVTVRNGLNGSTIVGPRTFVPGGGVARQAPVTSPLFITAAGSPIHYELSGSGTIGGDIAWIQETSA